MSCPCESLTGRRRDICTGEAKTISQAKRRAYIERWLRDGSLPADPDAEPIYATSQTQEPSLLQKAASFARATIRHVADGAKCVSEDEQARRMSICRGCEHFDAERVKCRKCGCGLSLKTRWRTSTCPLNLWGVPSEPASETS